MEIALLLINTLLLLVVLAIMGVMLYRLERARRIFEARQEEFERSLDTLAQLTDSLDALMRRFGEFRDKAQMAGDIGRVIGRWRKGL